MEEDSKAALRQDAVRQRAALADADRKTASKAAAAHFINGIDVSPDQMIAAYWPIRDEIDCRPVLAHLMDNGQPLSLPAVVGENDPLVFRRWAVGAALYEAGFGTLGPAKDAEIVEPDMIIIPLLGFDRQGNRLGYGKGHYDRTIAVMQKKPVLVGYAFAAQKMPDIPAEPHDVPLNYLVTENGVRQFG